MRRLDCVERFQVQATSARYHRNWKRYGTHEVVLRQVPPGSSVLDVGCATGYLSAPLRARGCLVWGLDNDAESIAIAAASYEEAYIIDLEECAALPWAEGSFDVALCADVVEHLRDPERALRLVRRYIAPGGRLVLSVPNVAHLSVRFPLLFGRFDYGPSGILDETHLRFFTFKTALALVASSGYRVERVVGGSDHFGRPLERLGDAARFARGLLAYNIIIVATPER
jgi:2-polyprenyl-3-methyl-5-hydroxy-6-metoxy-1,4-benzoquinol methylase